MGYVGYDDILTEMTSGKIWRADFMKNTSGIGTVVAGRWYDLAHLPITGGAVNFVHGNYIYNYDFLAGTAGWTLSSGLTWTPATHVITKSGSNVETLTQNTACSPGVAYSVVYTLGSYTGSGPVTVSLGGTSGTGRTANGTYRETITCGSTSGAPLTITVSSTVTACTLDVIAVTRDLAFTPYDEAGTISGRDLNLIWHGGNTSPDTKHLVNMGAWVNLAAGAPAMLVIVDMLGCYPRIRTDLATLQTLTNPFTLPRYTNGNGVRAYLVLNTSNGANAQNTMMLYTNSLGEGSRGLGTVVSNTASAIVSHIFHSGAAAGNTGPFLPLAGGDAGVRSVQSVQFSAASASAGFVDLVLCRPLATIPLTQAFFMNERDYMNQLPSLPRVMDGACLNLLVGCGAVMTTCVYQGYIDFAWG